MKIFLNFPKKIFLEKIISCFFPNLKKNPIRNAFLKSLKLQSSLNIRITHLKEFKKILLKESSE